MEPDPITSTIVEYVLRAIPDSVVDWIDWGQAIVSSWLPSNKHQLQLTSPTESITPVESVIPVESVTPVESSPPIIPGKPAKKARSTHSQPFSFSTFYHPSLDSDSSARPINREDVFRTALTHLSENAQPEIYFVLVSNPFQKEPLSLRQFSLLHYRIHPSCKRILLYSAKRHLLLFWLNHGQQHPDQYLFVRVIIILR